MDQGFIDLRRSADVANDNANFWPSFTDIMTVVVMIFMLASVVLILRNWELVAELRNTMEAERRAAALARSTSETNATLEEQLAQAQHLISELRMQLMQAEESDQLKTQILDEREQRLARLEMVRQQLEQSLVAESSLRQLLAQQVEQGRTELETANRKLAAYEVDFREQSKELERLRKNEQHTVTQLGLLQGEYDQLKVKYDKLVKPARTAKGKHRVEVRYEKIGGAYRISFKDQGDGSYRIVERRQLEQLLGGLKKRNPRSLYVKIIIPDESGLSYSEAWAFMSELLKNYDYYYQ